MKFHGAQCINAGSRRSRAFTLAETLVAMAVAGIMIIALYGGMATSTFSIRMARENLRATQIIMEKMEVIRLLTWEQLTSSNILPATFTVPYYAGDTNATNSGLVYNGKIRLKHV